MKSEIKKNFYGKMFAGNLLRFLYTHMPFGFGDVKEIFGAH